MICKAQIAFCMSFGFFVPVFILCIKHIKTLSRIEYDSALWVVCLLEFTSRSWQFPPSPLHQITWFVHVEYDNGTLFFCYIKWSCGIHKPLILFHTLHQSNGYRISTVVLWNFFSWLYHRSGIHTRSFQNDVWHRISMALSDVAVSIEIWISVPAPKITTCPFQGWRTGFQCLM